MKYRTKPCEIEAIRFTPDLTMDALYAWAELDRDKFDTFQADAGGIRIRTLEGVMMAKPGDYIVCGLEGEFYPVKPSIFERKYELMPERSPSPLEVAHALGEGAGPGVNRALRERRAAE